MSVFLRIVAVGVIFLGWVALAGWVFLLVGLGATFLFGAKGALAALGVGFVVGLVLLIGGVARLATRPLVLRIDVYEEER